MFRPIKLTGSRNYSSASLFSIYIWKIKNKLPDGEKSGGGIKWSYIRGLTYERLDYEISPLYVEENSRPRLLLKPSVFVIVGDF